MKAPFLKYLLQNAADVASLASQIAMCLLFFPDIKSVDTDDDDYLQLVCICLETLRKDWFDQAQIKRLQSCVSLQDPNWPRTSAPQLLQLLFEAGAPVSGKDMSHRNMISIFLVRCHAYDYGSARIDILVLLVGKGVDVNQTSGQGLTPSMYARYRGWWNEWCEALRRNNKNIEDVVQAEKNEWLLSSEWRREWERCVSSRFYQRPYNGNDEEDDDMSLSSTDDMDEGSELADEDTWEDTLEDQVEDEAFHVGERESNS
jgi:hypothetical protein